MFLPVLPTVDNPNMDEHANERLAARHLFDRVYRRALRKRMTAAFQGHTRHLLKLNEQVQHNRHYEGLQLICLDEIKGSEGRDNDFDTEFLPVREHVQNRWVNVAIAFLEGKSLPPVELIRKNDTYYVRDGHHRISVARAMRFQAIEAEVVAEE